MILYDIHVHFFKKDDVYEILHYAEILGLKLVGLVSHHKTKLKNYIDLDSNIEVLWGIEMKYPFASKPKNYDFVLVHLQNIEITPDIIKKIKGDIIAHPTAYNLIWTEEALEELKSKEILVEFNSSHYRPRDVNFYNKLVKMNVDIIYGSDAHTPENIYSSPHPDFVIPLEKVKSIFLGK